MIINYQRPPLRVAILGLGRSFFEDHYPVFKAHPALFKVVAACDWIKERRDRIAGDFPHCRMFRQYADMLDEREIDVVDICSCTTDHVKHAVKSLEKGYWTLLETPIALTYDDCQFLRGASMKAKNHLLPYHRDLFSPDFMLARQMVQDPRLGEVHKILVNREDYVRRDDWQTVKRLGGGACYYALTDLMILAMRLIKVPPFQIWSELKRIASVGDAEDYVHVIMKTREMISAEIEFNGGCLKPLWRPSFVVKGSRGEFSVMPGATEGTLTAVDPNYRFDRRRSSVRTPKLADMHEEIPIVTEKITLPPDTLYGQSAFWKAVYDTVRTAAPFPLRLEESIEAVKFSQLMKNNSAFSMK